MIEIQLLKVCASIQAMCVLQAKSVKTLALETRIIS